MAWDEIEAGARIAVEGFMVGAETVAQAGVWLVEQADAKQCELGMSLLLGTLFAVKTFHPMLLCELLNKRNRNITDPK